MTPADLRKMLEAATPGPWWQDGQGPWKVHHGKTCDRLCTANHGPNSNQSYSDYPIVIASFHEGDEENLPATANAKLIAAAPTALKILLDAFDAVEGLHKPKEHKIGGWTAGEVFCMECSQEAAVRWPCPTAEILQEMQERLRVGVPKEGR